MLTLQSWFMQVNKEPIIHTLAKAQVPMHFPPIRIYNRCHCRYHGRSFNPHFDYLSWFRASPLTS